MTGRGLWFIFPNKMVDFPPEEFKNRANKAQLAMAEAGIDALLFSTEAEVRYYSGFRTLFWQSQTRVWFLILPQQGEPLAVIPQIGAALMSQTWVRDIRTFAAPMADDNASNGGAAFKLLATVLKDYAVIGLPLGAHTRLGMPLAGFDNLRNHLNHAEFKDATSLLQKLRQIKSSSEIEKITLACAAASRAFARAAELFYMGQSLKEVFRVFKTAVLEEGAEDVPYLVGAAGAGGYHDVISPPTAQALKMGDVLMLDTGATVDGYYCDFDRNFAIEKADDNAHRAYDTLYAATEAGLAAAQPGARYCDIYLTMAQVIRNSGYGDDSAVGRWGHGLGAQLTETPSVAPWEETVLSPNMVLTLEPSLNINQEKMMVHEENIVITESGCRLLSERSTAHLPVLGGGLQAVD